MAAAIILVSKSKSLLSFSLRVKNGRMQAPFYNKKQFDYIDFTNDTRYFLK